MIYALYIIRLNGSGVGTSPSFVEKSHPEAAIEQVRYRMVSSVIIVDRHPFLGKFRIPCLLRIKGVNIANIVPA